MLYPLKYKLCFIYFVCNVIMNCLFWCYESSLLGCWLMARFIRSFFWILDMGCSLLWSDDHLRLHGVSKFEEISFL
jgi:hypothetical protein